MNVAATDPTTTALAAQSAGTANPPAKKTQPAPPPPAPAALTPAATVAITGVPATVKPEDRSLYMQILKSVGGNVNAALAALAAAEAKETDS
jgi:hypothetical protein